MNSINVRAARKPDRRFTRLVFIDAFKPPLDANGLPYEIELSYDLSLTLESGGKVTQHVSSCLPIVTPPSQVPRVVPAGLALTKYDHDSEYAKTALRTKRLWFEFAELLADARDAYFVRPLTTTPDPCCCLASSQWQIQTSSKALRWIPSWCG